MEISLRHPILIAIGILCFLWVSDQMRKPSFKTKITEVFKASNYTNETHSVLEWLENKSFQLAGFFSLSMVTILNSVPVSFIIKIYLNFKYFNKFS